MRREPMLPSAQSSHPMTDYGAVVAVRFADIRRVRKIQSLSSSRSADISAVPMIA